MSALLEMHFNNELDDKSREAILEDCPKSNSTALVAPRIDKGAATHMRHNFKNVHFGTEKHCTRYQNKFWKW